MLFEQALEVHRGGFRGLITIDLDCPSADSVRVRAEQEARGASKARSLLKVAVLTSGTLG